ncbi:MAG: ArnT family glycosyltransferase [Candidatus Paceibacterales bacterium]
MRKKTLIFLLIIIAVASFFRLPKLDSIPPGLYPDEAINGNEAITNPGQVFYPENNGREGLFINLIHLSFSIFGISIWSLRLVSAVIGILTVLGLYLLTKQLFIKCDEARPRHIALLSSFLLAISFWHVNFSRIGFRAILVPFILVFSFYFLFKGLRTQRKRDFIIAGVFFGLGFYTYSVFRSAVVLLAIVFLLWWLIYRKQNLEKKFLFFIFYFLFFIFIIALPIGIYFLQNPKDFIGRTAEVSIFTQDNKILAFGTSLISHLGMFNLYGDSNWRHNISKSPVLFWPVGILFLIGIAISIKKLIASIEIKNYSLFTVHCSLLFWFFIMLSPGILTYEGIPHSLRAIGAIPPTFIFAGMGIEFLWRKVKEKVKINKFLIFSIVLFFLSLLLAQYWRYFIFWGKNPEVENAFSKNYVKIGNHLNSLPPEAQKFVVVNQSGVPVPWPDGIPMSAQTTMFIENKKYGKPQSVYLLPEDLDKIKVNKMPTVIAPLQYDQNLFKILQIMFPEGKIQEKDGILIYQM